MNKGFFAVAVRTVGVFALLLLIAVLVAGESHPLEQGVRSPPIVGKGLDGRVVEARAFGPRPFVVNMWATWCPPCLAELPHFATASVAYQGKVDFIGLAAESPQPEAAALIQRFGIPYPNVLVDGATQSRWNARALPSTYLVDKDGIVRWSITGAIDGDLLADKIQEHLGVPPPSATP